MRGLGDTEIYANTNPSYRETVFSLPALLFHFSS